MRQHKISTLYCVVIVHIVAVIAGILATSLLVKVYAQGISGSSPAGRIGTENVNRLLERPSPVTTPSDRIIRGSTIRGGGGPVVSEPKVSPRPPGGIDQVPVPGGEYVERNPPPK